MKGFLTLLLAAVGVVLVVVAFVYFALPAHSLPTFFPAHGGGGTHAIKHGLVALLIGVIALGIAGSLSRARSGTNSRSR